MARQKLDLRRCDLSYFSFAFSALTLLTKAKTVPMSSAAQGQAACAFTFPARKERATTISLLKEDVRMRHYDLTPLYRSTIGFDRLGSLLDTLASFEGDAPSYPPYNIERVGENEYRISMAIAGFGEKDLSIEVKENTLSIRGEKKTESEDTTFLHRGIASRSFERRFQLADHVVVKGASLENGLLHVDLVRELPDAMKPRTIAIKTDKAETPKVIDSKAA
jgi:molecular chaperone IbpA